MEKVIRKMKAVAINENYWDARISITEAELNPGIIVKQRKRYIKPIEQERDITIKDFVVVEHLRLKQ